jgi:hypothetical protein
MEFLPAIKATPIPKVNFLVEEMQAAVGGVSITRYGPADYALLVSSYDPGSFKYKAILRSRMAPVAFMTEIVKTVVDRICTDAMASGNINCSLGETLLAGVQASRTSIQEILHQSGVQAELDEAIANRTKLFRFIGKFSIQSHLNLGLAGITLSLSEVMIASMNKADAATDEEEEEDEFECNESKESTELQMLKHDGNGKRLLSGAGLSVRCQIFRATRNRWPEMGIWQVTDDRASLSWIQI